MPVMDLSTHAISIPYAPFQKSDKIHRIADWHDPALDPSGRTRNAYGGRTRAAYGAGEANAFGYVHEEDEKSFSLVDSGKPMTKSKNTLRPPMTRGRGGARGAAGGRGRGGPGRGGMRGRGGRYDFKQVGDSVSSDCVGSIHSHMSVAPEDPGRLRHGYARVEPA